MRISDWSSDVCSSDLFDARDQVLIRIERQEGGDVAQQTAVSKVKEALADAVVEYRRIEFVGPTVGEELQVTTVWAVLAAIGAILLYVWFRFEWQFGIAAIAALAHACISIIGLFSLLGLSFELSAGETGRASCRERWCKYV